MSQFHVEPIQKKDFAAVAELVNRVVKKVFVGHYPPKIIEHKASMTPEAIAKRVAEGDYWVIRDEAKVVAVVGLVKDKVRTFFVDLEYQNQGLGRKLYEVVEEFAKNKNLKQLRLYSSLPAVSFYKKLGFEVAKEFTSELHGETYKSTLMKKNI